MIHTTKGRGMEHFRGEGYLCGSVESQRGQFRADLFGLFDFVVLGERCTWGVQACMVASGEIEEHKLKMVENTNLKKVFTAGWGVYLICFWPWAKEAKRHEFKLFQLEPYGLWRQIE